MPGCKQFFTAVCLSGVFLFLSTCLSAQDNYVIKGTLNPVDQITKATLKCRATGETFPIKLDKKTGAFQLAVTEVANYDISLETTRGLIEGVDMTVSHTDLGLARPAQDPLTEKDKTFFKDYLSKMKTFENKRRIMSISGDRGWARVLVELIRDRKMTLVTKKPSMTYRVEIWDFKMKFGTWRKSFERAKSVQFRMLFPIVEFVKKTFLFEPKLGGLFPTRQNPTITVDYTIPEDLTKLPGHIAETKPTPPEKKDK